MAKRETRFYLFAKWIDFRFAYSEGFKFNTYTKTHIIVKADELLPTNKAMRTRCGKRVVRNKNSRVDHVIPEHPDFICASCARRVWGKAWRIDWRYKI